MRDTMHPPHMGVLSEASGSSRSWEGQPGAEAPLRCCRSLEEPRVLGPSTQHPTQPWLQPPEPARSWGSTGKSGFKHTFPFGCCALSQGQEGAGAGSWRGQPVPFLLISLSSLNHTPAPTACNALKNDRY